MDALSKGETVAPESFTSSTVQFSDVDGFDELCAAAVSPMEVVNTLNTLYNLFDNILEKYDVFKVEAVNDALLVNFLNLT